MSQLREVLKRSMPKGLRQQIIAVREKLAAPPLEDIVLHDYELEPDDNAAPRLSLIIPTIAPDKAFGGVVTGIDVFFGIGRRARAELRVIVDDFGAADDPSVVLKRAKAAGVDPEAVEIVPRTRQTPRIAVRANDAFFSFNWWTTLNLRPLLRRQAEHFGGPVRPYLYAIQEYEP